MKFQGEVITNQKKASIAEEKHGEPDEKLPFVGKPRGRGRDAIKERAMEALVANNTPERMSDINKRRLKARA
jgi:hypothetical protein